MPELPAGRNRRRLPAHQFPQRLEKHRSARYRRRVHGTSIDIVLDNSLIVNRSEAVSSPPVRTCGRDRADMNAAKAPGAGGTAAFTFPAERERKPAGVERRGLAGDHK
jgi:hypothetical protein